MTPEDPVKAERLRKIRQSINTEYIVFDKIEDLYAKANEVEDREGPGWVFLHATQQLGDNLFVQMLVRLREDDPPDEGNWKWKDIT